MYSVIGVRFKKAGKIYYFDPLGHDIVRDCEVIVETARGIEFGKVVTEQKEVAEDDVVLPLRKVIRVANKNDLKTVQSNDSAAKDAFEICFKKIGDHQLDMKLVDAEYTFDRNKVIFYFTADGRVDFRELVKDLASIFRTRIELRQIGVRDEAKILGGLGPCGRPLCCSTWLGDFEPVSIKMAKDQNLSLNPTKISGLCGRLMCCLKYEHDNYESMNGTEVPSVGKKVVTSEGEGKVISINAKDRLAQILLFENNKTVKLPFEDVAEQED
ncbi:PSP1 domain-containing protein [Longirhabdus pacifica]|uniref:PSP1 domain-containing protein n=1 Tax=Longirhabdus pacifica TaxID=2305227 RepID=UPI001008E064|nr:stage 0 sporulation family protein [Longirhabdus pacifica]